MKGFLDYLAGDSFLHKMHPIAKLIVALLLCISSFVSANFYFLIGLILFNMLLAFLADGKSHCGVFKRALGILKGLLKMSVFLLIIQLLVIRSGNIVIPLGKKFGITDTGLINGTLLVLRLMAATLPLSIVITVTNLNDLTNTLVKDLHIPYKYAFTLSSAIRFIPVFSVEMACIIDSQKSRGVDFEIKNPFKKLALILPLCFPLLISSVRKIEATAMSTELRGFYLRTSKSCYKTYRLHFADFAMVILTGAIFAAAIIL